MDLELYPFIWSCKKKIHFCFTKKVGFIFNLFYKNIELWEINIASLIEYFFNLDLV